MITPRKLSIALGVLSIALTSYFAPAFAQDAQAPTVTDTHTSGDWTVRCFRAQTTVCEMAQVMVQRNRNVRIASVEINYIPKTDSYIGRFGLPLGVSFDKGLGLEFGTFKAVNLKYRICSRDSCFVTGTLPSPLVQAMKNPGTDRGFMDIQMIDGRKAQIPIALNGFSDGIDLLKKWTVEKAAPPAKK